MWNDDHKNNDKNHSKDDRKNGHSIDICGWEIKLVNNGLDEAQVGSIISELISQRDSLSQQTEHLSSLTRLAEKTVAEADKLAEEMSAEATKQAEAEGAAVIARIEERAQQLESEKERTRLELREAIDGICRELMSLPETFKEHIMNTWTESENRLNKALSEQTSPTTLETHEVNADSQEPVQIVE